MVFDRNFWSCVYRVNPFWASVLKLDEEVALIVATPALNDIDDDFCNNEQGGHRYKDIIPKHLSENRKTGISRLP